MKDNDYIKELFSEKLSAHEVPVRSDLWSGIQSQLGNTAATTVAAKGISIAAKWAIGIASSVIVAGSVVWLASDGEVEQKTQVQLSKTEQKGQVAKAQADKTEVKPIVSETEQTTGNVAQRSINQNEYSDIIEELKDRNVGVMDNAPLIVLPAVVNPVEDRKVANHHNETPAENKSSSTVHNSKDIEPAKTVSEETKVVGEIAQWKKTNVFSPNGDRVNDVFFLENKNLKEFQITIYNNATKKTVFTSTDPDFKWYGDDAPDGSYGYVVIALDENGNRIATANELMIAR